MTEFFLTVVNMSISASWIVLAVLLLRLVLTMQGQRKLLTN